MILAADIGGTNARLALFDAATLRFERRYASAAASGFDALLARFLDEARAALHADVAIRGACLGVAGPVLGERAQLTNLPWAIDAAALGREFGIGSVRLVNDFVASAHGLDALAAGGLETLQPGAPLAGAPRVLLGAGTGLGVAYVISGPGGQRVVPSEGGHVGFAPADETQLGLWRFLNARHGRVEAEDVVSGRGLAAIYEYLSDSGRGERATAPQRGRGDGDPAAAIARDALEHDDPLANAALDLFVACYGAVAGDHALAVVARGGVYLAGGIAPKIRARLAAGGFLAAFNAKGAFANLARSIPVHVVLDERLGLLGAARCAAAPAADRAHADELIGNRRPR
jgi:glucokinase